MIFSFEVTYLKKIILEIFIGLKREMCVLALNVKCACEKKCCTGKFINFLKEESPMYLLRGLTLNYYVFVGKSRFWVEIVYIVLYWNFHLWSKTSLTILTKVASCWKKYYLSSKYILPLSNFTKGQILEYYSINANMGTGIFQIHL